MENSVPSTGIHNTCEIGRLRKVMLHRPGRELENLMPEYLDRLLFDDIPYLKAAQAEHDAFARCLRESGAEVVYLRDLAAESIVDGQVRGELIRQFLDEAALTDLRVREMVEEYFSDMDNHTLVDTIPGQMVIAVCIAAVFVSFAFVVKLTQPIEYRR